MAMALWTATCCLIIVPVVAADSASTCDCCDAAGSLGLHGSHTDVSTGSESGASSHGSGGSSGSAEHGCWWHHEGEYFWVECWMLVGLIMVALGFESLHHYAHHHSHHAYHFGSIRAGHRHHEEHKAVADSLLSLLLSRATGELTVLGFLAFAVWGANRGGVFPLFAEWAGPGGSGWHYPPTASDYLHMLEDVHMQLFTGMVFYFMAVWQLVRGACRIFKRWEMCDIVFERSAAAGKVATSFLLPFATRYCTQKSQSSPPLQQRVDAECVSEVDRHELLDRCTWQQYIRQRDYLIAHVACSWAIYPKPIEDILKHDNQWLNDFRSKLSFDLTVVSPVRTGDIDQVQSDTEAFKRLLLTWLPFGKYMAINARTSIEELIDFKMATWLFLIGFFAVEGMLARFAFLEHAAYMDLVFACLYLLGLVLLVLFTERESQKMIREDGFNQQLANAIHSYGLESMHTKTVQVSIFMIAQSSSRMISSSHRWHDDGFRKWCIAWSIAYVALVVVLNMGIAEVFARRFGLCSLGEFTNPLNLEVLRLLLEKHLAGLDNDKLAELPVTEGDLHKRIAELTRTLSLHTGSLRSSGKDADSSDMATEILHLDVPDIPGVVRDCPDLEDAMSSLL